jgi:hypothetical protein
MPSEAVDVYVGQLVGRRLEDAVSDARVEMGVAVEPGAEAVEDGDGAESRAGGWRRVLLRAAEALVVAEAVSAAEALVTEQLLNLRATAPGPTRRGWPALFATDSWHPPESRFRFGVFQNQ